jgi:hypothetical protein
MFGLVEHHGTCSCSARATAADPPPPAQGGGGEPPAEHPAGQPAHFLLIRDIGRSHTLSVLQTRVLGFTHYQGWCKR